MNRQILVVDDDPKILNLITVRLKKQGYEPLTAVNGKEALQLLQAHDPSVVLLDVRLPDIHGTEVLREILKIKSSALVIMISAHAEVQTAVECIKLGAVDFLEKPFEFPALDAKVKHFFKQINLEEEVEALRKELGCAGSFHGLIGSSPVMRKVFQSINVVAPSEATVLIEGESGTGKELVARAIHACSAQKDGPFITVNCGAIPENLIESELFGHEKGSFTGASAKKAGKFEQANGGTIFLDEVSELPLPLQVKLLRVLQEREIERVGGSGVFPVRVRVVAASNRNLRQRVTEGEFREDLFYRLNVFPIILPPLRERREDIAGLFASFLEKYSKGKEPCPLEEGVLEELSSHDWPGNVRELENFAHRLMLLAGEGGTITKKDIRFDAPLEEKNKGAEAPPSAEQRKKAIGEAEKMVLIKTLQECGGNVAEASRRIQVSRDTFYRKMKKYEIVP